MCTCRCAYEGARWSLNTIVNRIFSPSAQRSHMVKPPNLNLSRVGLSLLPPSQTAGHCPDSSVRALSTLGEFQVARVMSPSPQDLPPNLPTQTTCCLTAATTL